MLSQAAQYLGGLRLNRMPPESHARVILSTGLESQLARAAGGAGANNEAPLARLMAIEKARRVVARKYIAALGEAIPDGTFSGVEFQYARSVPLVFTVHARADESYAIGMDADIEEFLRAVFLAAVAAHEVREFDLFGTCVAELIGVYHMRRQSPETAESIELLCDLYQRWPAWVRTMIDGFRDAAAQFLISHELAHVHLGHFAEGGALRPGDDGIELSAFPDQARELAADEWAAEWTLKAARSDVTRQTLCVVAPFLCMRILSFVSLVSNAAPGITRTFNDAHPAEAARAIRLRRLASRQLQVPPTDALKIMVDIDDYLESEIGRSRAQREVPPA